MLGRWYDPNNLGTLDTQLVQNSTRIDRPYINLAILMSSQQKSLLVLIVSRQILQILVHMHIRAAGNRGETGGLTQRISRLQLLPQTTLQLYTLHLDFKAVLPCSHNIEAFDPVHGGHCKLLTLTLDQSLHAGDLHTGAPTRHRVHHPVLLLAAVDNDGRVKHQPAGDQVPARGSVLHQVNADFVGAADGSQGDEVLGVPDVNARLGLGQAIPRDHLRCGDGQAAGPVGLGQADDLAAVLQVVSLALRTHVVQDYNFAYKVNQLVGTSKLDEILDILEADSIRPTGFEHYVTHVTASGSRLSGLDSGLRVDVNQLRVGDQKFSDLFLKVFVGGKVPGGFVEYTAEFVTDAGPERPIYFVRKQSLCLDALIIESEHLLHIIVDNSQKFLHILGLHRPFLHLTDINAFLPIAELVLHEIAHQVLPQLPTHAQQLVRDRAAGQHHELHVVAGQTAQLIEIKQSENKLDFVLRCHQLGEQHHGSEQLEPVNKQRVVGVEKGEDVVELTEDVLKLGVVDGEGVRYGPIHSVELLDFGQRLVGEEGQLRQQAALLGKLREYLPHLSSSSTDIKQPAQSFHYIRQTVQCSSNISSMPKQNQLADSTRHARFYEYKQLPYFRQLLKTREDLPLKEMLNQHVFHLQVKTLHPDKYSYIPERSIDDHPAGHLIQGTVTEFSRKVPCFRISRRINDIIRYVITLTIPLLEKLNMHDRFALLTQGILESYMFNRTVCRKGEQFVGVYLVVDGEVKTVNDKSNRYYQQGCFIGGRELQQERLYYQATHVSNSNETRLLFLRRELLESRWEDMGGSEITLRKLLIDQYGQDGKQEVLAVRDANHGASHSQPKKPQLTPLKLHRFLKKTQQFKSATSRNDPGFNQYLRHKKILYQLRQAMQTTRTNQLNTSNPSSVTWVMKKSALSGRSMLKQNRSCVTGSSMCRSMLTKASILRRLEEDSSRGDWRGEWTGAMGMAGTVSKVFEEE